MRSRGVAGLVVTAALALASCEAQGPERASDRPSAEASNSTPSATQSTSTPPASRGSRGETGKAKPAGTPSHTTPADAAHAVEPPGPRDERLYAPDILVTNDEPLDDSVAQRIQRIRGISSVTRLSVAQVPVENTAVTVAAVDPGRFRLYTEHQVADLQAIWDRVAGGELATKPELRKKLPLDERDYLRLGVEEDAPLVHVGAYAPLPHVDAVVNPAWGEELGMPEGNALLISTDIVAPQQVRDPIQQVVGPDASVQMGDAIARFGLDPDVRQTAVPIGTAAELVGTFRYRVSGGRVIPDAGWVQENIRRESVPILGSITCHKAVFPQLRAALEEIVASDLAGEIHPEEYAGCYYPRFIAGTTELSNHSFGLAFDINVPGNLRGTPGELHRGVVAILESWGFAWGGRWQFTDPMHFELATVVDPREP